MKVSGNRANERSALPGQPWCRSMGVWAFPLARTGWRLQVPLSKTSAASGQWDRAPQGFVFVSTGRPSLGLTSSRLEVEASASAVRKAAVNWRCYFVHTVLQIYKWYLLFAENK